METDDAGVAFPPALPLCFLFEAPQTDFSTGAVPEPQLLNAPRADEPGSREMGTRRTEPVSCVSGNVTVRLFFSIGKALSFNEARQRMG